MASQSSNVPIETSEDRAFLRIVLKTVEEHYVVVKGAAFGMDGLVFFCIPIDRAASFQPGRDEPRDLRDSICVLKCPRRKSLATDFVGEIFILNELRTRAIEGCVELTDFHISEYPWMAMKWIRGGTVMEFLAKQKPKWTISPDLLWHVLASLLETVLTLRTGGDDEDGQKTIVHADIHLNQVMFDPYQSLYPPYPGVKLIDFGRTMIGDSTQKSFCREQFDAAYGQDLKHIATDFHDVAHGKVRSDQERAFQFHDLVDESGCICIPTLRTHSSSKAQDFDDSDAEFAFLIHQLTSSEAKSLTSAELRGFAATARRRCAEASKACGRWGTAIDPSEWDVGPQEFPDKLLLDAVAAHKANTNS